MLLFDTRDTKLGRRIVATKTQNEQSRTVVVGYERKNKQGDMETYRAVALYYDEWEDNGDLFRFTFAYDELQDLYRGQSPPVIEWWDKIDSQFFLLLPKLLARFYQSRNHIDTRIYQQNDGSCFIVEERPKCTTYSTVFPHIAFLKLDNPAQFRKLVDDEMEHLCQSELPLDCLLHPLFMKLIN